LGLFFKSKHQITADDQIIEVQSNYNDLLKSGDQYKKIQTKDVIGLRASESGFKSVKIMVIGAIITIIGLNLLISLLGTNTLPLIILSIVAIAYGAQKNFEVAFDYFAGSKIVPMYNSGSLKFLGTGAIPFSYDQIIRQIFKAEIGGNPHLQRNLNLHQLDFWQLKGHYQFLMIV
jgi:hypothetical protein